jgi:hypothetical protein
MSTLRYARQYVLPEIGTEGQARIEALVIAPGDGDARATEVALAYLERAGARRAEAGDRGSVPVPVPDTAFVARIAGRADLVEAAAFLAGALAATATIARIAGAPARPIVNVPALAE